MSSSTSASPCRRFTFAEIQSATEHFNDNLCIGEGGFGKVYTGKIVSEGQGLVVAIKRLHSMSNQGEPEFRTEIEMLSKLRHCHLVSLIGYCDENKEMILVYKYMRHGTLYHHLHKAETPLNWVQRMKIAIGAGRGLDYLHTGIGTHHAIIHRDVKTSNILLDENFAALISDFGLSTIGPTNQSVSFVDASVKGTFGYLDPNYFYTGRLTRKTDVFAFGVVLLELLSGRLPVDIRYGEDQCSLVVWAQKCLRKHKLDQMVDSNIKGTIFPKCLRGFAQIAGHCLHSVSKKRPTMTEVVASLQALLQLQVKSASSSGLTGFTWKIHKYLVSETKQISDQCDTSLIENSSIMHNGSFDELLRSGAIARLPLATKVKIAVGIARGVVFLNTTKNVSASRLCRCMIMLYEDFSAKFSYYTCACPYDERFPDNNYDAENDPDYYIPGWAPLLLYREISGFEVVFAEILTGERIFSENENWMESEKNSYYKDLAEVCFTSCNEMDSESRMLTMLKDNDNGIWKKQDGIWKKQDGIWKK